MLLVMILLTIQVLWSIPLAVSPRLFARPIPLAKFPPKMVSHFKIYKSTGFWFHTSEWAWRKQVPHETNDPQTSNSTI